MKKLLFLLIPILLVNCKKRAGSNCEEDQLGTICVTNSSDENVIVEIEGKTHNISIGRTSCHDLSVGLHSVTAYHVSGYVWPPNSFDVVVCMTENYELLQ